MKGEHGTKQRVLYPPLDISTARQERHYLYLSVRLQKWVSYAHMLFLIKDEIWNPSSESDGYYV